MHVMFSSQCEGAALRETRRVLDTFATRTGPRTWIAPMTMEGLDAVRAQLAATARKNTAVACVNVTRRSSELLWVVGARSAFGPDGEVAVSRTRSAHRGFVEHDWRQLALARDLARMAALFHDFGKASPNFQDRLHTTHKIGPSVYRHEWVSLCIFASLVNGRSDADWLGLLSRCGATQSELVAALADYARPFLDGTVQGPFALLPAAAPLARYVGWLIVSHHKLPAPPAAVEEPWKAIDSIDRTWLDDPLGVITRAWNTRSAGDKRPSTAQVSAYWPDVAVLPYTDPDWRLAAARTAAHLDADRQHLQTSNLRWATTIARTCINLADHSYSSLPAFPASDMRAHAADGLYANTSTPGCVKQPLTVHLIGVSGLARRAANRLPGYCAELPRVQTCAELAARSRGRFAWQNKAADVARSVAPESVTHGALVINMASTGYGKTRANGRILYVLSGSTGLRMTYTLGLRSLTAQTGRKYRENLRLGRHELAVRIGGGPLVNGMLLSADGTSPKAATAAPFTGSKSSVPLFDATLATDYLGGAAESPLLDMLDAGPRQRGFFLAPVLVCTLDHVIGASEAWQHGRQVVPLLRLLGSDLVIDEIDDYDMLDLPAVLRTIRLAALLGARVVVSSATLPEALARGVFDAYASGRADYATAHTNAATDGRIPCVWADEFSTEVARCGDHATFAAHQHAFATAHASALRSEPAVRRYQIAPVCPADTSRPAVYAAFADTFLAGAMTLHLRHAQAVPSTAARASFGICRMANIHPLIGVALALAAHPVPADWHVHLLVYHSRFPLLVRSLIERTLDAAFDRHAPESVLSQPSIQKAIAAFPDAHEHIFVVLASPACEVGRDWDADWAVAEPSSVRSLIQLAGRVHRHRAPSRDTENILVTDYNVRALVKGDDAAAFYRPGYERDHFRLAKHAISVLFPPRPGEALTSAPRALERALDTLQPTLRLDDLEQARVSAAMSCATVSAPPRDSAALAWELPSDDLNAALRCYQPFRNESSSAVLVYLPCDPADGWNYDADVGHWAFYFESKKRGEYHYAKAGTRVARAPMTWYSGCATPWWIVPTDLPAAIERAAGHPPTLSDVADLTRVRVPFYKSGTRWTHDAFTGFDAFKEKDP